MLLSGWILPDMYEVKCKSCSTLNGHIEVVKRYLENLKAKDILTYDKIILELHKEMKLHPYIGLDDFAVMCLGWIKVNNDPINIVFYARDHELEFLIQKHIDFGYLPVILERGTFISTSHIPSYELI